MAFLTRIVERLRGGLAAGGRRWRTCWISPRRAGGACGGRLRPAEHGTKPLRRHWARDRRRRAPAARCPPLCRGASPSGQGGGTIGQELGQLRAALRHRMRRAYRCPAPGHARSAQAPPRASGGSPATRLGGCSRRAGRRTSALHPARHAHRRPSGAIRALTWDRVDLGGRLIDFADPAPRHAQGAGGCADQCDAARGARGGARRGACRHVVTFRGRPIGASAQGFAAAAERAGLP